MVGVRIDPGTVDVILPLIKRMCAENNVEDAESVVAQLRADVDNNRALVYALLEEREVLGCISLTLEGKRLFVNHLVANRPGVGRLLLKQAEQAAEKLGANRVRGITVNPRLLKIAHRFGYSVAGVVLEKVVPK